MSAKRTRPTTLPLALSSLGLHTSVSDCTFSPSHSFIDGLRQNLLGGVSAGQHISEVTNASRTLLLNIRTLEWDPVLLRFFGLRESVLPRLVSTSEVYGNLAYGPLKGVPLGGLVGDQQGALIGNKCLTQGQAKCTYGTGAFLLFCTGTDIVYSNHGLLSTVRNSGVLAS